MGTKNLKILLFISAIVGIIAILAYQYFPQKYLFRPNTNENQINEVKNPSSQSSAPEIIAQGLDIPWEVSFLPNGAILVTERSGQLIKIDGDQRKSIPIQGVTERGESGLLGMVLHPKFADNNWIYLYITSSNGGGLTNRVERYKFENDQLTSKKVIIENIPGAIYHDGGRIAFGPDNHLYITTGDATKSNLAQDTNSLAGKILRLNEEGEIPSDNPFKNPVYSYGHRNPQGITWDQAGNLWETEHGRSGVTTGYDEVNLIIRGGNYGWPEIEGDEEKEGMISPSLHSGSDNTWAPASALFSNGKLYFTGLRGEAIYEATIKDNKITELKSYFFSEFGRLRALLLGPDGYFYFTTSNRDGRGIIQEGDDKIIKFKP